MLRINNDMSTFSFLPSHSSTKGGERTGMPTLSPVDPDSKMIPDQLLLSKSPKPSSSDGGVTSLDTNVCKPNTSFIWCLPPDYNQEKHPFTCENKIVGLDFILLPKFYFRFPPCKPITSLGLCIQICYRRN